MRPLGPACTFEVVLKKLAVGKLTLHENAIGEGDATELTPRKCAANKDAAVEERPVPVEVLESAVEEGGVNVSSVVKRSKPAVVEIHARFADCQLGAFPEYSVFSTSTCAL